MKNNDHLTGINLGKRFCSILLYKIWEKGFWGTFDFLVLSYFWVFTSCQTEFEVIDLYPVVASFSYLRCNDAYLVNVQDSKYNKRGGFIGHK